MIKEIRKIGLEGSVDSVLLLLPGVEYVELIWQKWCLALSSCHFRSDDSFMLINEIKQFKGSPLTVVYMIAFETVSMPSSESPSSTMQYKAHRIHWCK